MNTKNAFLLLSYGSPEGPGDVGPYLDNVLQGKNVSPQRKAAVAEKYARMHDLTGRCSPGAEECRQLLAALQDAFEMEDIPITPYWANLYWHPLLADTFSEMVEDGVHRVFVFPTTAFVSPTDSRYGLDRYDAALIETLQDERFSELEVIRMPLCMDHPAFLHAQADHLLSALALARLEDQKPVILFSAHSVPMDLARQTGYDTQIVTASRRIAELAHLAEDGLTWKNVWQSRSGSPTEEWIGPNVEDRLRMLAEQGIQEKSEKRSVLVVPVGFFFENMETVYDLDVEAFHIATELGLSFFRAECVGNNYKIVQMICDTIQPSEPVV